MRGALEGLPAHGTHVDALPAVHLLAVLQEHGGRCAGAAALQALVCPALLLGLPALRHGDVRHLQRAKPDFPQGLRFAKGWTTR